MSSKLRQALDSALRIHNRQEESLGLKFTVRLRQGFWIGNERLITPRIKGISAAVDVLCRLAPLCSSRSHGGGKAHVYWKHGLSELQSQWAKCKAEFVKINQEIKGLSPHQSDKLLLKIEGLEAAHSKHRERIMQRWELYHMQLEDTCKGNKRQPGTRFRDAFAVEELRLMRVERLVYRWQLKKVRQAAAEAAEKKAAERRATAIKRKQHKERWRQVSRRDLTMGEMLGSKFGSGLGA
eukprot:TRINITY_DN5688_c0_g3_i2.p1 TRINITY_DN5688_c0_g3~~TRINITY_DN5688_c0_g3_i2.p1  ORF type:complete len:267 (-),score=62.67 TRINITY_DN5688_c0_g3_i2:603-1316(-)